MRLAAEFTLYLALPSELILGQHVFPPVLHRNKSAVNVSMTSYGLIGRRPEHLLYRWSPRPKSTGSGWKQTR